MPLLNGYIIKKCSFLMVTTGLHYPNIVVIAIKKTEHFFDHQAKDLIGFEWLIFFL